MRIISLTFFFFASFLTIGQDIPIVPDTPSDQDVEIRRPSPPQVFLSYDINDGQFTVNMEREDPGDPGVGCSGSHTHLLLRLPFNKLDTLQVLNSQRVAIDYSYNGGLLLLSSQRASKLKLRLEKIGDTLQLRGFIRMLLTDNSIGSRTKDIELDLKFIARHDVLKVLYTLNGPEELFIEEEPIVQVPELEAEYPGGQEAMMKFISENIQYPPDAKEMCIQGRVFISLIVERDGSLSRVEVVRGVHSSLDKEALRVTRAMSDWIPAEVGGKNVRSKVYIPISFIMK